MLIPGRNRLFFHHLQLLFYIISYPIKMFEFTVSLFLVIQSTDRMIVNISVGFIYCILQRIVK